MMKNRKFVTTLTGGLLTVIGLAGVIASTFSSVFLTEIVEAIPEDITLGAPILKFSSAINLLMEGGNFSFTYGWAWDVLLITSSCLIYAGIMLILGGFRDDVNIKDVFSLKYWTFVSVIKTRKARELKARGGSKLLKK